MVNEIRFYYLIVEHKRSCMIIPIIMHEINKLRLIWVWAKFVVRLAVLNVKNDKNNKTKQWNNT